MSKPTVLHVTAVEFTARRLLRPQLAALAARGYSVRLACAPEGVAFSEELLEFDPIPLSFPRSLNPVTMGLAGLALRRLIRQLRPDLVHFHSPAAAIPGRAILALGPAGPPIVYTVHGFLHTWDARSCGNWAVGRLERLLSRWTDISLFQSAEDHAHAKAAGYAGIQMHLGNGIADEWFQSSVKRRTNDTFHVMFVGRLIREKGVLDLLEAARALPDMRWTIVGSALPTDRRPVEAAVASAARQSKGRIRHVAMVSPEEVREHLLSADLLVLPSWREGLPRSLIEGMACGLPVVATNIRGSRELVEQGVNGWLVPVGDPTALAAAVSEAANLSDSERTALGAAGRARAWNQHREAAVVERLIRAYKLVGVGPCGSS